MWLFVLTIVVVLILMGMASGQNDSSCKFDDTKSDLSKAPEKKDMCVFDEQSIRLGKELLNHPMIKSSSMKLTEYYKEIIAKEIISANKNQCSSFVIFWVGNIGITRSKGYCVNSEVDVCSYKDFNISAIESEYKKRGIAWALQSLIIQQVTAGYSEIINSWVEVDNNYNQRVQVIIHFEMCLNKFQEL